MPAKQTFIIFFRRFIDIKILMGRKYENLILRRFKKESSIKIITIKIQEDIKRIEEK